MIRKTFLLAIGLTVLGTQVLAATDAKTAQFLRKLNLYYYCLDREGLKSFRCDLQLALPEGFQERIKDSLRRNNFFQGDQVLRELGKLHYVLTVSRAKAEVALVEPAPTGDEKVDDLVMKQGRAFGAMAQNLIQSWVEMTVEPFSSEKDLAENDFKVRHGADGFDVDEATEKGTSTSHFDRQARMVALSGASKDQSVALQTSFTRAPEGYLLQALDGKIDDNRFHWSIVYGTVGPYWLPQKWEFDMMVPGVLAEEDQFTLAFSGYRINGIAEGAGPLVHFDIKTLEPTYQFGLTTGQIEKVNKKWVPSRNAHEPGLTNFGFEWKFGFESMDSTNSRGDVDRFWITRLDILFAMTQFDVYVSSNYPTGSCPYRVILDHENTHVAINQRVFRKYAEILKQKIGSDPNLPTREKPWKVTSVAQGKAMFNDYVERVLGPLFKEFWREERMENAQIDLPSSYRKTSAECTDW
jgi:hypothetical protein